MHSFGPPDLMHNTTPPTSRAYTSRSSLTHYCTTNERPGFGGPVVPAVAATARAPVFYCANLGHASSEAAEPIPHPPRGVARVFLSFRHSCRLLWRSNGRQIQNRNWQRVLYTYLVLQKGCTSRGIPLQEENPSDEYTGASQTLRSRRSATVSSTVL